MNTTLGTAERSEQGRRGRPRVSIRETGRACGDDPVFRRSGVEPFVHVEFQFRTSHRVVARGRGRAAAVLLLAVLAGAGWLVARKRRGQDAAAMAEAPGEDPVIEPEDAERGE